MFQMIIIMDIQTSFGCDRMFSPLRPSSIEFEKINLEDAKIDSREMDQKAFPQSATKDEWS